MPSRKFSFLLIFQLFPSGYRLRSSLATVHHAEIILFHVIHTESLKEHFAGGYGEGLSFSPETPMKVRHEISVDNIFAIKKQMVLKFLDQKIRPDLRNLVKFTPLVTLARSPKKSSLRPMKTNAI